MIANTPKIEQKSIKKCMFFGRSILERFSVGFDVVLVGFGNAKSLDFLIFFAVYSKQTDKTRKNAPKSEKNANIAAGLRDPPGLREPGCSLKASF